MRGAARKLKKFTEKDLCEELGIPYNGMTVKMIDAHVQEMKKAKIVKTTGDKSQCPLVVWEYIKPTDEGAAAKIDKARKPSTPTASTAGPISGTGRKISAAHKGVQEILDVVVRQLGRDKVKQSGGHWAIEAPNGRVLISSTPSNPRTLLNDKARLRRAGIAAL